MIGLAGADDWVAMNPRSAGGPDAWQRNADIYLFLYGSDFRGAVGALATLSGRQPVPPRHVFGVARSRYWQFSAAEVRDEVVDGYEGHTLPLDLVNLDTAWHTNFCFLESQKQCAAVPNPQGGHGSVKGYGGLFEWDRNLYPPNVGTTESTDNPIIQWLRSRGISSYLDVLNHPPLTSKRWRYLCATRSL